MKFEKVKTFHKAHPSLSTLIAVGLVGILAGGGYYGYSQWKYMNTPEAVYQREAEAYKESWDEMMANATKQVELPNNEVPVLATVTNKDTLEKNAFYNRAENGDKIVMYKKNGIALLYRPSAKRIIAKSKIKFIEPTPEALEGFVAAAATSSAATPGQSTTKPTGEVANKDDEGLTPDKLFPQ